VAFVPRSNRQRDPEARKANEAEWRERRGEILPHLEYMLERFRVSWAVPPQKTVLKALEGTIIRRHGIEYLINRDGRPTSADPATTPSS
jgi:hypothetical protein